MATVLGKRKSRVQKADPSVTPEEVQAKLARCFGAEFKSLLSTVKPTSASEPEIEEEEEDDDDEESVSDSGDSDNGSWDGFSADEVGDDSSTPSTVVEVISHTDAYSAATNTLDKRESKAWLSSRPPLPASVDSASSSTNKKARPTTAEEDAPSLLKNDLALQRLLAESHLFSPAGSSGGDSSDATTEHVGRNRHLATDLRLAALGSKTSIYKQAKMPMAFRKGIQAAAEGRETKRRREARENGIVLERPGAASRLGKKAGKGKRSGGASRAIDAPAVGRMNSGMLKLSKRDIADIQGGGSRKGSTVTKKRRR
ncbi:hypothetical protein F5Y07DRAFT_376213 [Xylaria sp. FL0933]|nr:hypothetical protein F5Y07DRAFT_376213 [Xylaria sp. FL0933]